MEKLINRGVWYIEYLLNSQTIGQGGQGGLIRIYQAAEELVAQKEV